MRGKKKDRNHADISEAFEREGCDVATPPTASNRWDSGFADIVVYHRESGRFGLVEIKGKDGKLRPSQMDFRTRFPTHVARSPSDVPAIVVQIAIGAWPEGHV